MTPTCVPSTPGELPSCQRISCWQDESGESMRSVPPPQKQTFRSFSGPPHTPKGVAFEKPKDLYYRLEYPTEGQYTPKYLY